MLQIKKGFCVQACLSGNAAGGLNLPAWRVSVLWGPGPELKQAPGRSQGPGWLWPALLGCRLWSAPRTGTESWVLRVRWAQLGAAAPPGLPQTRGPPSSPAPRREAPWGGARAWLSPWDRAAGGVCAAPRGRSPLPRRAPRRGEGLGHEDRLSDAAERAD